MMRAYSFRRGQHRYAGNYSDKPSAGLMPTEARGNNIPEAAKPLTYAMYDDLPSFPSVFSPLSRPFPLKWVPARESGEYCKLPQQGLGLEAEPQPKSNLVHLVHFSLKI